MVFVLPRGYLRARWARWRHSFAQWGKIGVPRKQDACPARLNGHRCTVTWQQAHGADDKSFRTMCPCEYLEYKGLGETALWALDGKPCVLTIHVDVRAYGEAKLREVLDTLANVYDYRVCLYAPGDCFMTNAFSNDPYSIVEVYGAGAPTDMIIRQFDMEEGVLATRKIWWQRKRVVSGA